MYLKFMIFFINLIILGLSMKLTQPKQPLDQINQPQSRNLEKNEPKTHKKREIPTINYGLNNAENYKLLHNSYRTNNHHQETHNIQALNSLLGKAPMIQLEGLQQLLGAQDFKPITEQVFDVANAQRQPNVKVEHATVQAQKLLEIANFEKELNEASRVQAEEAFALAQKDALAQVQAQEQALVVARENAERAALAQIQSQGLYEASHYNTRLEHSKVEKGLSYSNEHRKKSNRPYASQYAFGYQVRDAHSGNDFGHEEINDGKTTKGHYHVLLPDGRMQNVHYWADETGYHAKVTYNNVAHH